MFKNWRFTDSWDIWWLCCFFILTIISIQNVGSSWIIFVTRFLETWKPASARHQNSPNSTATKSTMWGPQFHNNQDLWQSQHWLDGVINQLITRGFHTCHDSASQSMKIMMNQKPSNQKIYILYIFLGVCDRWGIRQFEATLLLHSTW